LIVVALIYTVILFENEICVVVKNKRGWVLVGRWGGIWYVWMAVLIYTEM